MHILKVCRLCKFFSFSSIVWLGQLLRVKASDSLVQNGPNKEVNVDTVCQLFGTEEHCYFLEKYSFQDSRKIQDLVSKCKDRVFTMVSNDGCTKIPFVSALAIETYDELLFIKKFMASFHDPQLKAFTSGYWSCDLAKKHPDIKDACGVWHGWNSSIDVFILQLQCGYSDLFNCSLANEMLFFLSRETSGEFYWKVTMNGMHEPVYIACEFVIEKYGNCSTTIIQPTTTIDFGSVETSEVIEISTATEYPGRCEIKIYPGTNVKISPSIDEDCAPCQKMDDYGNEWIVSAGEACIQSCPYGAEGYASWRCGKDGLFVNEQPNYINCHNRWIAYLENLVEQHKPVDEIAERFLCDSFEEYFFGHEIAELADLLFNVSKLLEKQSASYNATHKAEVYEDLLPKLANITNNIIKREIPWKQINMILRAFAGSKLQKFLYSIGFSLIDAIYGRDNPYQIYLDYLFSNLRMGVQLTSPNQSTNQLVVNYPKDSIDKNGGIAVHGEIKAKKGNSPPLITSVVTIVDYITGNRLYPGQMRSWRVPSKMVLNSGVISFEFKELSNRKLEMRNNETKNEPLRIESVVIVSVNAIPARGPSELVIRRDLFNGESPTAVIAHAQCVFWDDTLQYGKWDESGCKMAFTNETLTICNCSHLSSFGVFMSIHKYKNKGLAMELLSGICSGLSIICLVLTLIVFQFFGAYLQGERETICRNVCSCLLATHILSQALLDKTYFNTSDTLCSFVGALLHFVLSAGFFWMAAEGHHLYRLILRVMDGKGKDLRMTYYVLSYGTAVVLVGLTALVGLIHGEKAYGNPEICWLSLPNYQWSFISEALLISLVNSVVLTLSLKAAGAAGAKSIFKKLRIWLHGWFTLSSLLGITWLIGVATFSLNEYFEYVFVALNGLQGVWIFLSRVLHNEQLRNVMAKRWRKRTLLRRFYKNSISVHSSPNMGTSDKLRNKGIHKNQFWNVEDESNSTSGNRTLGDPKGNISKSRGIVKGRLINSQIHIQILMIK